MVSHITTKVVVSLVSPVAVGPGYTLIVYILDLRVRGPERVISWKYAFFSDIVHGLNGSYDWWYEIMQKTCFPADSVLHYVGFLTLVVW